MVVMIVASQPKSVSVEGMPWLPSECYLRYLSCLVWAVHWRLMPGGALILYGDDMGRIVGPAEEPRHPESAWVFEVQLLGLQTQTWL